MAAYQLEAKLRPVKRDKGLPKGQAHIRHIAEHRGRAAIQ